MKKSKLGIEKFRVTKLNNMSSIKGGEEFTKSCPTITDTKPVRSSIPCWLEAIL
ncbi:MULTISPECIES: hypothetical protein [Aquimarina]|uniref:hypothetical protein n=1 Tax=Aquimarina TaxID=290174 RepID=UPI001357B470|nr:MULTISPECIES: hypothetical protein [Aquimarina]